ncbi:MAG: 3-isopropylmalate dehydratase small subunit [Acidobacteria bacterium]|nr:3-isopropylmalate dehydratase small subunit [Acidobacteriota bacterium]
MKPFRTHRGLAAPLDRPNIDTDQIIPKQFLKRIERSGFGQFLFYDWAHTGEGNADAAFVLNQRRYRGASILLAGKNFGCGSSREHAAWALADFGFRVIIAPSFADIFATNAMKNGLLPLTLAEGEVATLTERAAAIRDYCVSVDLERSLVSDDRDFSAHFTLDEFRRSCLLKGLDDIGLTLRHELEIAAYEARRRPGACLEQA